MPRRPFLLAQWLVPPPPPPKSSHQCFPRHYNPPRLGPLSSPRRRVSRRHAQLARDSTSTPVGHRFHRIRLGEYIDFAKLLPDSLRNNELPRELMLEHQHLVILRRPPSREIRDTISWIDCWIAYCQVVLSFSTTRSVELLKYLDLIVRTHRSFPSADVWLRYDRGFRRKAACSPVPLDWGSTDLEVFHESYASSNVLWPASLSGQSFRRSGELRRGEAQDSPSASEISRTWNSGHCSSGFAFCRCRHECKVTSLISTESLGYKQ